jgi:ADP-dependent NAD(P)H-hydrate dehydratase / NAD(P)H-hydrate epimerase
MLLICGTIPRIDIPLITGEVKFDGEKLMISGGEISCTQGTAALVSAACATSTYLKSSPPQVVLAGDTGAGSGSRLLYDYLIKNLTRLSPGVLVLHYIIPIMGLMKKVVAAAEKCGKKPVMIADASSMYAAKAAGLAPQFDVFTPDFCEMAFLADPEAIHPAYLSRHLFNAEIANAGKLIKAAYLHKSAPKTLLIKGAVDHVVENGEIIDTISAPNMPAMEAIGGTGDTISGMIGSFIDAGKGHSRAALLAAKANRFAGKYAQAKPATKIRDIVANLPASFDSINI